MYNERPDADPDIESLAEISDGKTYFIPEGKSFFNNFFTPM